MTDDSSDVTRDDEERFFHNGHVLVSESNARLFLSWIEHDDPSPVKIKAAAAALLLVDKAMPLPGKLEKFMEGRLTRWSRPRFKKAYEDLTKEIKGLLWRYNKDRKWRMVKLPKDVLWYIVEHPSKTCLFLLLIASLQSTTDNDHVFCLNLNRLQNRKPFKKSNLSRALSAMRKSGVIREIDTPGFFVRENGKAFVWACNQSHAFDGDDAYMQVLKKKKLARDKEEEDDDTDGDRDGKENAVVCASSSAAGCGSEVESPRLSCTRVLETGGEIEGFGDSACLTGTDGGAALDGDWLRDLIPLG